jgi:hypothetical protein
MTCGSCRTELDISTKFCPQCGTAVAETFVPSAFSSRQTRHYSARGRAVGAVLLLAGLILVVTVIVETSASSNKSTASNSADSSQTVSSPNADVALPPPVPPKPQAPSFSDQTLHPYDLLKNPYQSRGKLIALNLNSLPVLYNVL